ncbi:MAG: DUF3313 family protein [Puniceicoccaceae bacterium]
MKVSSKKLTILLSCVLCMVLANPALARKAPPETTHDGLSLVKKAKAADYVYLAPDADLTGYKKIIVIEPHVAFRKGYKDDYNSSGVHAFNRLSDRDLEKMIARAKDLFMHEFVETLEKKGYPVVKDAGEDVLVARALIVDLEVNVPDPNRTKGMGRSKTFAEGVGEATFVLELYDSVSMAIIARAVDHIDEMDSAFGWRVPRDYATNTMDAQDAFGTWAVHLAKGLDRAKKEAK